MSDCHFDRVLPFTEKEMRREISFERFAKVSFIGYESSGFPQGFTLKTLVNLS
jgi:hypothetical protein